MGVHAYSALISSCILLVFVTVFLGSFVRTWPYDFSLNLAKHFDFPSARSERFPSGRPSGTAYWNRAPSAP